LQLTQLSVRNITFNTDFINAINQKLIAGQQAQQAVQEAERARTLAKGQADAAVTAAQGRADANVAEAKGDAQAIELRAAADAQALNLINQQLSKNPQLLQWRYIDKLGPDIKMVLIPSNSPYLFNLQDIQNSVGATTDSGTSSTPTATSSPTPTATPTTP